jgi:hypothetical protein
MPLRMTITDSRGGPDYIRFAPSATDSTQTDVFVVGSAGGDGARAFTIGGAPDFAITFHKVGPGNGVPVDADGYWLINRD